MALSGSATPTMHLSLPVSSGLTTERRGLNIVRWEISWWKVGDGRLWAISKLAASPYSNMSSVRGSHSLSSIGSLECLALDPLRLSSAKICAIGYFPQPLWVRQKGDNLSIYQQRWAEKLWYRHTQNMSLLSYSPRLLASSVATISKTYPDSISFPLLPRQNYHHHLSPE